MHFFSRHTLESILANVDDGIIVIDDANAIAWCNNALLNVFAYSRQELIGKPLDALIPAALRDGHARHLARFRQSEVISCPMTDRGQGNAIEGIRSDGSAVPLSISVAKISEQSSDYCVAVVRDITAMTEYQKTLRKIAELDHLTGLLNRRAFIGRLSAMSQAPGTTSGSLAILVIDHFKRINDRHGHVAGDEVLAVVGRRLNQWVSQNAIVARWGGEEFVTFHPEVSETEVAAQIEVFAETLRSAPLKIESEVLSISLSAGVSRLKSSETLDDALKRADRSLYAAKAAGRNQVLIANSVPQLDLAG